LDKKTININPLESIILIGVMTVLGIFGLGYVPYVLFFPAVFTIFSIKNGVKSGIVHILVIFTLIGLIQSFDLGIFLLIIILPISLILTYMINKRRSSMETIVITMIVFFILILLILKFVETQGINFMDLLKEGFNQTVSEQLKLYEDMDLSSLEMFERKNLLENTYNYILSIMPAVLLIISLIVGYLNYLLTVLGLRKMKIKAVKVPKFSRFRLTRNIIPVIVIILLASFFIEATDEYYGIILNLIALAGFVFFIQGLSVVDYFLKRKTVGLFLRVIIYFFSLFIAPIITLLGSIDAVFNFRKIKTSRPL